MKKYISSLMLNKKHYFLIKINKKNKTILNQSYTIKLFELNKIVNWSELDTFPSLNNLQNVSIDGKSLKNFAAK